MEAEVVELAAWPPRHLNAECPLARVRCDHCQLEYLLAFSCKGRGETLIEGQGKLDAPIWRWPER
jgi:hypothetical protein